MAQARPRQDNVEEPEPRPLYEQGEDYPMLDLLLHRRADDFAEAVTEEIDLEVRTEGGHSLNRPYMAARMADPQGEAEHGEPALLVYPDETRQFVGIDETAKGNGLFSFIISPDDDLPMVRTAEEALDLLKPPGVNHALVGGSVARQGEWWLLETEREPASRAYKPGVGQRPFGGSPLGSHVPREWAMGVSEEAFMNRVSQKMPEALRFGNTPHEIFDTIGRAQVPVGGDVELISKLPDIDELRKLADGIFVRGTLRHRRNDHFMESIGEEWKLAKTHDVEVFSFDEVARSSGHSITLIHRD